MKSFLKKGLVGNAGAGGAWRWVKNSLPLRLVFKLLLSVVGGSDARGFRKPMFKLMLFQRAPSWP